MEIRVLLWRRRSTVVGFEVDLAVDGFAIEARRMGWGGWDGCKKGRVEATEMNEALGDQKLGRTGDQGKKRKGQSVSQGSA